MHKHKQIEEYYKTLNNLQDFRHTAEYIVVRTKQGDFRVKHSYLELDEKQGRYVLVIAVDD